MNSWKIPYDRIPDPDPAENRTWTPPVLEHLGNSNIINNELTVNTDATASNSNAS